MNLPRLAVHQVVNLSLAVFLFLGIAVTSYTVYNFTGYEADAARRVKSVGTLTILQNGLPVSSVAAGSAIEVRGSGLGANKTLYVGWEGQFGLTAVTTDGSGNFTQTTVAPSDPGSYTGIALSESRRGSWSVVARVPLTVQ